MVFKVQLIDLGFATCSLANDTQVGIVDVPGHEGLVLNTSSGDGGIQPLATQSVYAASKSAISRPET